MKHLSIASLITCSMFIFMLDMIEPASGCHGDHHGRRKHYVPEPYETPTVQTYSNVEAGDSWALLTGEFIPRDSTDAQYIQDIGFDYKETGSKEDYQRASAAPLQDNIFKLRIEGLKPSTSYIFKTFLIWDNNEIIGANQTFTTKAMENNENDSHPLNRPMDSQD